jgi:hypothetical protein
LTLLGGAYRRFETDEIEWATALARDAFPDFAARIRCFGIDWLGRMFATDAARVVDGEEQVLLLEPGTGEALEIPAGVREFHDVELVEDADAAVAFSFFHQWLANGGSRPGRIQCVGYKVPLFLGGTDDLPNLELAEIDVYWTIAAQVLARVRTLPLGTPIGSVSFGKV